MIATISSKFECSTSELWDQISQTDSLQYVCAPILTFQPVHPNGLDGDWSPGQTYELTLRFLGLLPLGRHDITIIEIDPKKNRIVSSESGKLAKTWNHTIEFTEVSQDKIKYTDEVEIRAGLLTVPIWLFAHIFYRHRQRRWQNLLTKASHS